MTQSPGVTLYKNMLVVKLVIALKNCKNCKKFESLLVTRFVH